MDQFRAALIALLLCLPTGTALADTPPTAPVPTWPRTFSQNGNQLVLSQPQLDTWANRLVLTAHAAAVVTPQGGAPTAGVVQLTANTSTDAATRAVALSGIQVTGAQFPAAAPAAAAQATALAKSLLPPDGVTLSLDNLLAALVQAGQSATSVALNTTPPTIYLAEQPSRLVQFDGAPTFAPVAGTGVTHAINTNWPLLRDGDGGSYYLLDATGWLTSDALSSGEWQYTSQLPASFSQLPDTPAWRDVRAQIPAPESEGQPPLQVYVATTPAELIVMVGAPQYTPIPGTGISAISNTDSLVFWDGYASAFYYLVAGRWFTAPKLAGPWSYATRALPADLANIPADSALAAVLPSVPNTPEAREAALQAQIPRLATVKRSGAAATVTYDGAPQFAPIDGTALTYAVNTPNDVIRVGDGYYLCQSGVWFVAATPSGPWSVASTVPDAIYGIPPSSPLYNVTYVRVYQSDADDVVFGYTDGYLGEYVSDGVVTWGTGYYYPPYLAVGTAPYYYPRAYTYGCDAYYNPVTGRFARAGYGYGPYGGIAAGAGYDPATGAYTRRVAASDGAQSGAAMEAYNPRTATYAAGYQRSDPYASWGQAVVYGPSAAARAGAVSTDRGSVARVQTSNGADAVAATNGDRSAAVVRTSDGAWVSGGGSGDWYAGGDGNAYRREADGWQRADPGMPVQGHPVESHPVPPGQYVPSHDVPSYRPDEAISRGLDQAYAARQREMLMSQRYSGWGQRDFSGFGGGRYGGGFARGGGGGRR